MVLLHVIVSAFVAMVLLLKVSFSRTDLSIPVVGCLRTRNSGQHLEEYLSHHFMIGFTEIHLYDDSDVNRFDTKVLVPRKISTSQKYYYHDRRGVPMKKETDNLKECFSLALKRYSTGMIVSLDDDEFIVFPNMQELKFEGSCLWVPVKFFGSRAVVGDGTTLGTYHYRERRVHEGTKDMTYFRKKHPQYQDVPLHYLSYRTNQRKITLSPTKAIFALSNMSVFRRASDYLHGFSTNCGRDSSIWMAHFTRAEADFDARIRTFWKHIGNRNQRFTGSRSFLERYKRDRNRNEEFDDSVLKIVTKVIN